jgi:branched-chain amino acid transport system substrate-binding protein
LNNCFFSNHYFAEDTAEVVANFFAGYREKYDEEPSSFAALGYDAAYILVNAIEAAGSTDSEAIVEAMAATELEGVTGKITYEGSGDPVKVLTVIEIVDGKYTLFDRIHP